MTSIIDELYYGNLSPMAQIAPNDPKFFPLGKKIDATFEALKKKLSEEDSARLETLITDNLELCGMSEYAGFSHGLRLGVLLMSEVFSGGAK